MAFLSTSTRSHLCVLTRSADPLCIPQLEILPTLHRRITTGRPHVPPTFRPPPARRHFEPAPPAPTAPTKPQHDTLARRPTDRQIPFSHVYVLDPATQKRSATKHSLEELLAVHARAPQRQVVELLASAPDPIVRVTTRAELEARYKAARRALRQGARVGDAPKEVQFTWGVARADVEHKLRKARRDLEKGYRVVVAVTVKRAHRPSSQRELVAFADEIAQMLSGVAEECKEREITDRLMVLSFRKVEVTEDVS